MYQQSLQPVADLTKREYFAAMAMAGLFAAGKVGGWAVIDAVRAADALMKELREPQDSPLFGDDLKREAAECSQI